MTYFVIVIDSEARYVCLDETAAYERAELIRKSFNARYGVSFSKWKNIKQVEVVEVTGDEIPQAVQIEYKDD